MALQVQRHGTANSFVPYNAINLLQLSQRLFFPADDIDLLPKADTNSSQTGITLIVISNIHSSTSYTKRTGFMNISGGGIVEGARHPPP